MQGKDSSQKDFKYKWKSVKNDLNNTKMRGKSYSTKCLNCSAIWQTALYIQNGPSILYINHICIKGMYA